MKTIEDVNIQTWFSERELNYVPAHFVAVKIPLAEGAREWILEKLQGRFAIVYRLRYTVHDLSVAFEDPKEAMFYELTWA